MMTKKNYYFIILLLSINLYASHSESRVFEHLIPNESPTNHPATHHNTEPRTESRETAAAKYPESQQKQTDIIHHISVQADTQSPESAQQKPQDNTLTRLYRRFTSWFSSPQTVKDVVTALGENPMPEQTKKAKNDLEHIAVTKISKGLTAWLHDTTSNATSADLEKKFNDMLPDTMQAYVINLTNDEKPTAKDFNVIVVKKGTADDASNKKILIQWKQKISKIEATPKKIDTDIQQLANTLLDQLKNGTITQEQVQNIASSLTTKSKNTFFQEGKSDYKVAFDIFQKISENLPQALERYEQQLHQKTSASFAEKLDPKDPFNSANKLLKALNDNEISVAQAKTIAQNLTKKSDGENKILWTMIAQNPQRYLGDYQKTIPEVVTFLNTGGTNSKAWSQTLIARAKLMLAKFDNKTIEKIFTSTARKRILDANLTSYGLRTKEVFEQYSQIFQKILPENMTAHVIAKSSDPDKENDPKNFSINVDYSSSYKILRKLNIDPAIFNNPTDEQIYAAAKKLANNASALQQFEQAFKTSSFWTQSPEIAQVVLETIQISTDKVTLGLDPDKTYTKEALDEALKKSSKTADQKAAYDALLTQVPPTGEGQPKIYPGSQPTPSEESTRSLVVKEMPQDIQNALSTLHIHAKSFSTVQALQKLAETKFKQLILELHPDKTVNLSPQKRAQKEKQAKNVTAAFQAIKEFKPERLPKITPLITSGVPEYSAPK